MGPRSLETLTAPPRAAKLPAVPHATPLAPSASRMIRFARAFASTAGVQPTPPSSYLDEAKAIPDATTFTPIWPSPLPQVPLNAQTETTDRHPKEVRRATCCRAPAPAPRRQQHRTPVGFQAGQ